MQRFLYIGSKQTVNVWVVLHLQWFTNLVLTGKLIHSFTTLLEFPAHVSVRGNRYLAQQISVLIISIASSQCVPWTPICSVYSTLSEHPQFLLIIWHLILRPFSHPLWALYLRCALFRRQWVGVVLGLRWCENMFCWYCAVVWMNAKLQTAMIQWPSRHRLVQWPALYNGRLHWNLHLQCSSFSRLVCVCSLRHKIYWVYKICRIGQKETFYPINLFIWKRSTCLKHSWTAVFVWWSRITLKNSHICEGACSSHRFVHLWGTTAAQTSVYYKLWSSKAVFIFGNSVKIDGSWNSDGWKRLTLNDSADFLGVLFWFYEKHWRLRNYLVAHFCKTSYERRTKLHHNSLYYKDKPLNETSL